MRVASFTWAALATAVFASHARDCTRTVHTTTTITRVGPVATATKTRTVKGATSTLVIAAPSGFQPVQSSLPGAVYQGSGGSDPIVAKRDTLEARNDVEESLMDGMWRRAEIAARAGACQTTTSTMTKYFTKAPSTKTVISTSTSYATTTTVYAACASNNLADYYTPTGQILNGGGPFQISGVSFSRLEDSPTAYGCCVQALLADNSGAAWGYIPQNGGCVSFSVDTCSDPGAQSTNAFQANTASSSVHAVVLGNLPRGAWDVVGSSPPQAASSAVPPPS
ncbi:hypothetical protein BDY17DRAFT_301089 [Neohortaea acidophila]|uniref:Apple domain-containing protein n=1 Tax=Neohortaea acidophila TaxID=245834 RepID=A0A6A6PMI6_9PEZI|nr:uncharacterized protein BDY17DRAFT_301089 [Neohortaea acidophila]KAF2481318.1 hypothetical protein BDY17DRAFT_301089 [Neohortaea acidophila]